MTINQIEDRIQANYENHRQQLTDKIEAKLIALRATQDMQSRDILANEIKDHAIQYHNLTGDYYQREWQEVGRWPKNLI